jgi:hypothetical protein
MAVNMDIENQQNMSVNMVKWLKIVCKAYNYLNIKEDLGIEGLFGPHWHWNFEIFESCL